MFVSRLTCALRPFSQPVRHTGVSFPLVKYARELSGTVSNNSDERPKAARPESHAEIAVSSGRHVAEQAQKEVGNVSGASKKEEGHTGTSTIFKVLRTGMSAADFALAPLARVPLPELFSHKNRTYIITGAARGLGLTVARGLLESGAHVHCLDMLPEPDKDAWAKAVSLADSQNLSISYHQVDVTSQTSLSTIFARCFEQSSSTHPIRGLYVAAGINQIKPALEYTAAEFRKVIDVNLTGTFFCAQAFAKEWFERNPDVDGTAGMGASIVLTGSMSGRVANAGLLCTAYNASKAGVRETRP